MRLGNSIYLELKKYISIPHHTSQHSKATIQSIRKKEKKNWYYHGEKAKEVFRLLELREFCNVVGYKLNKI